MSRRVDVIVKDASALPRLLQDPHLPRLAAVLFAGSRAIGLRLKISALYQQGLRGCDDAAAREQNATHTHCISVLKYCHHQLTGWHNAAVAAAGPEDESSGGGGKSAAADGFGSYVHNRFDALTADDLTVLEDLMTVSLPGVSEPEPPASLPLPPPDVLLTDLDAAMGDVRVTITCFMLDLLEALKHIDAIWVRVRREEVPILTAVAVTTVALQTLDRIHAQMQMQFPSIRNAADFLLSDAGKFTSAAKIGKCEISAFYDELMLHYRVTCHFRDFLLIPHDKKHSNSPYTLLNYDRNREQIPTLIEFYQLLPSSESAVRNFFCAELTALFNKFRQHKGRYDDVFHSYPMTQCFLKDFLHFFDTKEITMPALFRCKVWHSIVSTLQSKDDLSLGRSVYLARLDSRRVMASLSYEDPLLAGVRHKMLELGLDLNEVFSEGNIGVNEYSIFAMNPLLAGTHALDLVCNGAYTTSLFKVSGQLCHLYSALRQEGFIPEAIPFLEKFSSVFCKYIYGNDEVIPGKGKYFSSSAVKFNFTADAIRFAKGMQPEQYRRFEPTSILNSKKLKEDKDAMFMPLSRLALILAKNKMWNLISGSDVRLGTTLAAVEGLANEELYGSRLLSMHCTKACRIFNSYVLSLEHIVPGMAAVAAGVGAVTHVGTISSRLILALNLTLLKHLDNRQDSEQGSIDESCRIAANEMVSFFSRVDFNKDLCILPKVPLTRREVFGTVSPRDMKVDLSNMHTAMRSYQEGELLAGQCDALAYMNAGSADWPARRLKVINDMKKAIIKNPLILQFVMEKKDIPSLLDYGLCVLKDMDLAEWLIQMKGISLRGLQLTRMCMDHRDDKMLVRAMSHIQLACLHRNTWGIWLMHAATQAIDISFRPRDLPAGDTAFHICCRYGDMDHVGIVDNGEIQYANGDDKFPMELLPARERAELGPCKVIDEAEYRQMQRGWDEEAETGGRAESAEATRRAGRVSRQLGNKGRAPAPPLVVTQADVRRAADAERELLAMLDLEDATAPSAKGKNGTSSSQGGGGNTKKNTKSKKKK
jgi:hypothetical protein